MKIALLTLGCKLNYAETATYARAFGATGMEVCEKQDASADAFLVNTCAVTTHSENKCRNIIRRCHRLNPAAPIVVTGCYAELRREEVAALEGVRLVFGASEKSRVVPSTLALLYPGRNDVRNNDDKTFLHAFSGGERTRSFLKVQDGCDNFCAYCTVPFARGRSRNAPICELLLQAREIASRGIKEVVLTGVNTGDFGRSTGESFLDLLKALDGVEGIERYRISSIEPNLLTEEIIDWTASSRKFLPHFHIPLQTGCDRLLRAVGRRYDTALFASRIDYIRKVMGPGVFLGIDVIVGLPGESEEDFLETYRFLSERIRPAFIHIFPYSPRPGTRAAAMPGQVQDSVKSERAARLEELCSRLHSSFADSCRGLHETVLWESRGKAGMMTGYTGNYLKVEKPYDASMIGQIEDIVL